MKMIINGKRYDTDTATLMASYDNGLPRGDFKALSEDLYKKSTGEFFLHGRGGALTYWSYRCCDGSCCNGKGIVPLSLGEAKEWVERQANDKYEEIFGQCAKTTTKRSNEMKINITDTAKTQAALNEIQGRSTKRCYDAKDLQDIAEDFAKSMEKLGVARARLAGCTIDFGGNYKPAKAYKHAFIGTVGTITFSVNGAFLTALERTCCTRRTGATLADAAKEAIVKTVEKQDY